MFKVLRFNSSTLTWTSHFSPSNSLELKESWWAHLRDWKSLQLSRIFQITSIRTVRIEVADDISQRALVGSFKGLRNYTRIFKSLQFVQWELKLPEFIRTMSTSIRTVRIEVARVYQNYEHFNSYSENWSSQSALHYEDWWAHI